MVESIELLARDEADVGAARVVIWQILGTANGHKAAYAALCKWTWRAMLERRLDDELASWHRLLLDAAGRLGAESDDRAKTQARGRLDRPAAAERLRALADLVRMSIDAANASLPRDLTARAHVMEILRVLADAGEHVDREQIKQRLNLRDANLSRVMTLLAANGLVERRPRGKTAVFCIMPRGLAAVASTNAPHALPPTLPLGRDLERDTQPWTKIVFSAPRPSMPSPTTNHSGAHDPKPIYKPAGGLTGQIHDKELVH